MTGPHAPAVRVSMTPVPPTHPADARRALWVAVIERALLDATEGPVDEAADQRPRLQAAAQAWFAHGGPGFRLACDLAGLDPAAVRAGYLRLMARRAAGGAATGATRPCGTPDRRRAMGRLLAGQNPGVRP